MGFKLLFVLPLRRQSSRLSEKIYKKIGGEELTIRVLKRVSQFLEKHQEVATLVAAVDDEKTETLIREKLPQIKIIMTDPQIESGSDRVYEAAKVCCEQEGTDLESYSAIVNIQGDMPFLGEECIDKIVDFYRQQKSETPPMLTCCQPWPSHKKFEDPSGVKVLRNAQSFAIYFSRFPVPFSRKHPTINTYLHIGIYAYPPEYLEAYCDKGPVALEQAEGLEQLRALYLGIPIKVLKLNPTSRESYRGVDTQEDLDWAQEFLKGGSDQ